MKKNIFLFLIIFLFVFLPIALANKPAQNSLGMCDVWFSKDSVNWENATAFTSLKLSEQFYVKVWVKAKIDLKSLSYHMSCYGPPYDFELLEKPGNLPDNAQLHDFDLSAVGDITFWAPEACEEHTVIWKLRVTPYSDFANGNVPLNIDFEFFGEETQSFYFTVVSVNIVNQTWVDYTSSDCVILSSVERKSDLSDITLGVEIILVFVFLSMIIFFKKRK